MLLFDFKAVFDHTPGEAAMIVFNLILIESMLSVDNALVMATMVLDLPKEERGKALRYGIFGAYFFRGIALVLANFLLAVIWLKAAGGLYLLYLTFDYFRKRNREKHGGMVEKHHNPVYRFTRKWIGLFWSTVILVNVMDLAFSIDNVFAAVAYTNNIYLICTGVFIGILAIRFVAQGVIKLLERFSFLTTSAFLIIGLLGCKLILSFICGLHVNNTLCDWMEGENSEHNDLVFSVVTIVIFIVPVLTSWLFNFPRRNKPTKQTELIDTVEDKNDGDVPLG